MRLIVGLGNKGNEYENTRHNMGFMLLDNYLKSKNGIVSFKKKFDALYVELMINNEKVIFIKPLTYMNNSGYSVSKFKSFYKISSKDILVISDDLDLNLGTFRLRADGSSGGHNGLKSIIEQIGTTKFKRLRVGISNDKNNVINYVLSKFNSSEMKIIEDEFTILRELLDDYFTMDFVSLMSKYNGYSKKWR